MNPGFNNYKDFQNKSVHYWNCIDKKISGKKYKINTIEKCNQKEF